MTIASRIASKVLGLPAATTKDLIVDHDLPVPMRDGAVLLATRYAPRTAGNPPTVLVRSSYGRTGLYGLLYGRLYSERGFNVVLASTRGTFGSGGTFDPFAEREDGLDTVAWLRGQPWFSGVLGTAGVSYLGLTQWALAADAGPELRACAIVASASQFRDQTYPGGSFSLANALTWTNLLAKQEKRAPRLRMALATRSVAEATGRLPLGDLDRLTTGSTAPFWQSWLTHSRPGDDDYWRTRTFDRTVSDVTAPVTLVGGWYDIFLPWQVADYIALRAAGHHPSLTIGPWSHTSPAMIAAGQRASLEWFAAHLRDDDVAIPSDPVRIFVTGAQEWRSYPSWPPPGTMPVRWHLHGSGRLGPEDPPPAAPSQYRYDPASPTPGLSGPLLGGWRSRPADNRELEARADVLSFTSDRMASDTDVIGPVSAELFVSSSLEHADFFARLCDVHPDGRSMNVCDGLVRVTPAFEKSEDGTWRVTVSMWPTAHRFARGHRLRLQVSSGAHPRFARNTGTDEPLRTATTLRAAQQSVHHGPRHPSALILPVAGA